MNYTLYKKVFILIGTLTVFSAAEVIVSEVNYNPEKRDTIDSDEYEFIELKNPGTATVSLDGYAFTAGIRYSFPKGDSITAGAFKVIAYNAARFTQRYGFAPSGVFTGHLDNKGEKITLSDTVHSRTVASFTYGTDLPWPKSADWAGFTLVPVKSDGTGNPSDASWWRASTLIGGSPGKEDSTSTTVISPIYVNEILTHTDDPLKDAIELYNPNKVAVDISYWYLTDKKSVPKKFPLPKGTVLQPDSFVVFDADDFNKDSTTNVNAFNLSQHGDGAYVFSADSAGNLTGFVHGFDYGEIDNGISYGRHVNSAGEEQLVAMSKRTLGAVNSAPMLSPVVINEICYNASQGASYISVKNICDSIIKLYDPLYPANTWKISGITFFFPQSTTLKSGEIAYVASDTMSVAAFRQSRNIPATVKVYSFSGTLSAKGETIGIKKPCEPYTQDTLIVPYMDMDIVKFNNVSPWPLCLLANYSLFKKDSTMYGNDPASWVSKLSSLQPTGVLYHRTGKTQIVSNFMMEKNRGMVSFSLSTDSKIDLNIFDLKGNVIYSQQGLMKKGAQRLTVNKGILATGIYVVRLQLIGNNELVVSGRYLLK